MSGVRTNKYKKGEQIDVANLFEFRADRVGGEHFSTERRSFEYNPLERPKVVYTAVRWFSDGRGGSAPEEVHLDESEMSDQIYEDLVNADEALQWFVGEWSAGGAHQARLAETVGRIKAAIVGLLSTSKDDPFAQTKRTAARELAQEWEGKTDGVDEAEARRIVEMYRRAQRPN